MTSHQRAVAFLAVACWPSWGAPFAYRTTPLLNFSPRIRVSGKVKGLVRAHLPAFAPYFFGAFNASVGGDWGSSATFGGAGVPGSGDSITINDGILLACTDARTIGSDAADDTAVAMQTNGSNGTGIFVAQAGCDLTLRGSVKMGDSTWYLTPGSQVNHYASAGTGYSWAIGQVANKHAKLVMGLTYPGLATSSTPVILGNLNPAVPAIGFAPSTNPADAGMVEMHNVRCTDWGVSARWFIRPTPVANNVDTTIEDSRFTRCGAIALAASTASSDVSFQGNTIIDPVLTVADGTPHQSLLVLSNNTPPSAGVVRTLKNNWIEGSTYLNTGNFSLATTASAAAGATSVTVASPTSIGDGQMAVGAGFAPLTYVVGSPVGNVVSLSQPTYAALSTASVRFARKNGWTIEENAFVATRPFQYNTIQVAAGGAGHVVSWRNNVIIDQSVGANANGNGNSCAGGHCRDTILVLSSATNVGGGPYPTAWTAPPVDIVMDGWYIDVDVPQAGEGDTIIPTGAPPLMVNILVMNTILGLPRDGAQPPNWWTSVGTQANYTYWSEHNTAPQSTSGNTRFGFGHGWEGGVTHAGIFQSIRSNLFYGTGNVGNAGIVRPNSAATAFYPPPDAAFVAVDYNGYFNFPAGPYETAGQNGFTSAKYVNPSPPGTHDVAADPRLRDNTRTVFTWAKRALGHSATDGLWAALPSGTVAIGTVVANPKSDMYAGTSDILYVSKRQHTKSTLLSEPGASTFRGTYSAGATYVAGDLILDSTATSNTTSHVCILSGAPAGTPLSNATYFAVDPTGTLGWRYYWEPLAYYLWREMLPARQKIGGMSPVLAALEWLRAGHSATSLAFKGRAHDGGDIGQPIRTHNGLGITGGGVY